VLNVDRINRIDPAFAFRALAPAAGHAPPLPHKAAFRYPRDRVPRPGRGAHHQRSAPTALMGFTPFAVLTLSAGVVDVSIHSDPPAVGRTSASIILSRDRPRDDFITHIPMLEEASADHGRSLRLLGFIPADNWLAVGLSAIGDAVLPWASSSLRFSRHRVFGTFSDEPPNSRCARANELKTRVGHRPLVTAFPRSLSAHGFDDEIDVE
jgi:hypothetical protein